MFKLFKIKCNKENYAFTLSEVLLTLAIIGIISVLTVPIIMEQYKWMQYKVAAKKALLALDENIGMFGAKYGKNPVCGYWVESPYVGVCSSTCYDHTSEEVFNDGKSDGIVNCVKSGCIEDGSKLPADFIGPTTGCKFLYQFYKKNFKTVKVCDSNALANGCIPNYKGFDELYRDKVLNEEGIVLTDYEVQKASAGGAFRKSKIDSGSAFITTDGMIFFPHLESALIMAVDVNGFAPPNKWGYDLHTFMAKTKKASSKPYYYPYSGKIEKGGKYTKTLIYGK